MTLIKRKAQIESARGYKGRPVVCHRAIIREWRDGEEFGDIIETSSWRPHQSGLGHANRKIAAWRHEGKIDV